MAGIATRPRGVAVEGAEVRVAEEVEEASRAMGIEERRRWAEENEGVFNMPNSLDQCDTN